MTTINDDEYPYEKLDSIDPLVPADSGTLFFALDPGRPGFWKTQGDPFLGPWVSNLGPFFFKSRVTLKNGIQGNIIIILFFFTFNF